MCSIYSIQQNLLASVRGCVSQLQGLPPEFTDYVKYARNLKFDEDPDYKFLKSVFEKRLSLMKAENPGKPMYLDWITKTPDKYKDIIAPP